MAISGTGTNGGAFNPYGGGSKVYNGGSSAATVGTVDPMGYINRELSKPSDSRSGLAAAALNRLNNTGTDPSLLAGGSANPSIGTGSILSPIVKPLQINDLGQIKLPASSTLPLDSDLVAQMAAGTQAAQNQLMQLQQSQQALSQAYATQAHRIANQEPVDLNTLLSNFAGRGLAHSSGYGQGVQNLQDQYMNTLDDLFSNAQNQINNIVAQSQTVPNQLDSLIAQLQGNQSQRNIQNAGTLGLNDMLAQLLNPDTNKQFYGVINEADKEAALKAGVPIDQIVYVGGNSGTNTKNQYGLPTGIGNLPGSAQNVIYVGQAANSAPSGSRTIAGINRDQTRQLIQKALGV